MNIFYKIGLLPSSLDWRDVFVAEYMRKWALILLALYSTVFLFNVIFFVGAGESLNQPGYVYYWAVFSAGIYFAIRLCSIKCFDFLNSKWFAIALAVCWCAVMLLFVVLLWGGRNSQFFIFYAIGAFASNIVLVISMLEVLFKAGGRK